MTYRMEHREARQTSFIARLEAKAFRNGTKLIAKRSLILGHCIAAVEDNDGECNIFFATSMWMPIKPYMWGDYLYPLHLEAVGMGRLEGICSAPRMNKVEHALLWTSQILCPICEDLDLWERDHLPVECLVPA